MCVQVARLERQSELLEYRLQVAQQEAATLAEATAAAASQHSKQLVDKQVPVSKADNLNSIPCRHCTEALQATDCHR